LIFFLFVFTDEVKLRRRKEQEENIGDIQRVVVLLIFFLSLSLFLFLPPRYIREAKLGQKD